MNTCDVQGILHVCNLRYFLFMSMAKWRIRCRKWILTVMTHNSRSPSCDGGIKVPETFLDPVNIHLYLHSWNHHRPPELVRGFKQSFGFQLSWQKSTGHGDYQFLCKTYPSIVALTELNFLVFWRWSNMSELCIYLSTDVSMHLALFFMSSECTI